MTEGADVLPRPRPRRAFHPSPAVRRVADALVAGDAIQWDAAELLARTNRERAITRELRSVAWLAMQADGETGRRPHTSRKAAPQAFEVLLWATAIAQVLAALVTWALAGAPSSGWLRVAAIMALAGATSLLLRPGRLDVRSRALALVLSLVGALQSRPLLDDATASGASAWLQAWWRPVFAEAFLPIALWRLARVWPVVVRFTRFDVVSRGVLAAAVAWSLLLASASAAAALRTTPPVYTLDAWWLAWRAQDPSGPFWTALLLWSAIAIVTMAVRARDAAPAEARRLRVWVLSCALGATPLALAAAWSSRWPSLDGEAIDGPRVLTLVAGVLLPWLAAWPMLVAADVRMRRPAWQWLLVRAPRLLAAALTVSLLVPVAYLYAQRRRPLNTMLLDGPLWSALGLAALCAVLLVAIAAWNSRDRLRRLVDRSHRSGLADVAADVSRGRTPREIAEVLVHHVQSGLDVAVAAVLVPAGEAWTALAGTMPDVPSGSATAALLRTPGEPLRIDEATRLFGLLPALDQAWLRAAGIEALARLSAPDGHVVAGLLIGARGDGRPYSRRDLAFLSAACSTAAVALDARARPIAHDRQSPINPSGEDMPYECASCGRLGSAPGCCDCGSMRSLASLPARLGDKFELERRLGRGGMGVVYLALDTRLGRHVALKTLPRLLPGAVDAMHAEARAMAAVEHPSVALLYGLEIWRDTPVLVVEYLGGGTLAARLADGPLPLGEAVALGTQLADALAQLHRRGWLHRDIKPGNIGFGRNDSPKLLDFGLTRLMAHGRPSVALEGGADAESSTSLAGTPLYLSPEALDGRPAGEHMDVWALALVLFEMVAGIHPFRGSSINEVLQRIGRQRAPDVLHWAPATPLSLAQLLQRALHPQLSQRLATAAGFADALRVVGARL